MSRPVLLVAGKNPLVETTGGHSSYVRTHARAALRAGFEPHIFCLGDREETVETDFGIIEVARSPAPGLFSPPHRSFRTVSTAWNTGALASRLERHRRAPAGPVLIHGFSVWSAAGVRASGRNILRGVPSAAITSAYTSVRHEYAHKLVGSWKSRDLAQIASGSLDLAWVCTAVIRAERASLRAADLVLYNYDSVRRLLERCHGASGRFRKLPYASEAAFRSGPAPSARRRGAEPIRVTAVSRHDPRKGLDVLLRALAALRASGVSFRAELIGGGALLQRHRRLRSALGLDAHVRIEGYVDDAFARLASTDIFVLPSREEGSGSLSLLEALQAGTAVVASGIDGIPEDVTDGDSALLVAPGDERALAAALKRVIENAELRSRLARRGRQIFEEKFSACAFSSALGRVYEEMIERAASRKERRS